MILKVKRVMDKQEWWILDDIRKISIGEILRMSDGEIKEFIEKSNHDIVILDYLGIACSYDGLSGVRVLICRKTDESEFSIVFDTMAYLCNDEGKTIEKIVV